jgi:hypothetical protein
MKNRIYYLVDVFDFGKYKGKTIEDILIDNPGYVDWVIRNVDSFALSRDTFQQAKSITEGKRYSREEVLAEPSTEFELIEGYKGWDFDFSKADILIINNLKIRRVVLQNKNTYSTNSYHDDTNWTYYNDDFDMDQQSEDFWDQF